MDADYLRGHELYQGFVRGDAMIGLIADVSASEREMLDALWRAAERGLAAAFRDLGDCYLAALQPSFGAFDGVSFEDAESRPFSAYAQTIVDDADPALQAALRCYAEAARLGDREAAMVFAKLTRHSTEEVQDIAAAGLAALAEPTAAETYQLGLLHHWQGKFTEAAALHHRAAQAGDLDAQFELYVYYAQGIGVDPDASTSAQWLQRAADGEHPRALYNVGASYATGSAGEVDMKKAAEYYHRAAERGNGRAAATLGIMVLTGELDGTREQAIAHLDHADELGYSTADMLDAAGLDDPRS
jgi:hypothetical protein